MRTEARVVKFLDGVLHVLMAQELYHTGAILVGVREAHIACLTHMVLQILPRTRAWETSDHDTVLGTLSRRPATTHTTAITAAVIAVAAIAAGTAAPRELYAQAVPVVVVTITGLNCVIRIAALAV